MALLHIKNRKNKGLIFLMGCIVMGKNTLAAPLPGDAANLLI
ncbi:hypothetical protein ABOB54_22315 [Escherichia fergusonii]